MTKHKQPAGPGPRPEQSETSPAAIQPAVVIARRAAEQLRAGRVWVYRTDVERLRPADGTEEIPPGSLTAVLDSRDAFLGTALYSSSSMITLRMVSPEPLADRAAFLQLLQTRLVRAITLRQNWLANAPGTDGCHLVFAEADELPGIVIDRYADLVIVQLLSQGTHVPDVRAAIVATLREQLAPETIVERPDPRIRELEQLPAPSLEPLYSAHPAAPVLATTFSLNDLRFHYDANAGQKTGAFLDQRENYAAAERHAHGRALDVCTYQGGFALHLARRCAQVTGVDVSRAALEVAEKNLQQNRARLAGNGDGVEWVEADAFDLLRGWSDAGEAFDTIVLDPPAFAKSKRAAANALRGYKEMNLRALKMLRPGGTLVTCSCSHHVPLEEFQAVVAAAAGDAGRRVRLLETRGAALDHPAVLTLPETQYLKCLICRVE